MRNIVDEAGEIIAKATDDHTLIGGHHRLAVAASRRCCRVHASDDRGRV